MKSWQIKQTEISRREYKKRSLRDISVLRCRSAALIHGDVLRVMSYIFVRGADELALVRDLLQPVRAPACHPRDREDRGDELRRYAKHGIYESAVEVDICADGFKELPLALHEIYGDTLYTVVENVRVKSKLGVFSMKGYVDGELSAEATTTCVLGTMDNMK